MLVTSTTNAGTSSTLDPGVAATFSWTTSPAQAYYEFKWREVGTIIWTGTGRVQSSTMSHTVAANTFTKNKHIEWNVRVWDDSQAVSAWYGMDVLIAEAETKQLIKLADQNLKAVSFGKSKVASKVKFKDPDSSIYELDVVSIDDYAASKIRIKQDSGAIVAAAKKLNDYDATTYSDHSNTGNILYNNHTNTGYAVYVVYTQSGYAVYGVYSQSGYGVHNNYSQSGSGAYYTQSGYGVHNNYSKSGYAVYNNHSNYSVYGGGYKAYSKSGYSVAYSNHTNSYANSYSNHTNYYRNYSDHTNSYANSYSNHTNSYSNSYNNHVNTYVNSYSDRVNTGTAAYSDHIDSFSRSY